MARRVITREFYDSLVEAYAAHPDNSAAAARAVGCDPRTAKRGWMLGWPSYEWARPIKDVIAEQQEAARALAVQHQREQEQQEAAGRRDASARIHQAALLDAAQQREQDAKLARGAKQLSIAANATAMHLLQRGYAISSKITDDELAALPVAQRVRTMRIIAEFAKDAVACAEASIKLERLILGEPTEVTHTTHAHVHTAVAPDEMAETIARAQRAVERAREAGILDVPAVEGPVQ